MTIKEIMIEREEEKIMISVIQFFRLAVFTQAA